LIVLAILGVSLILMSLPILQMVIYIIGFIFLMYMAWSLWNEKPNNLKNYDSMSEKKQIGFALSVSLLNPHAIMNTIGVIVTSSSVYSGTYILLFSTSTIVVSWLLFVFLAILGKLLGSIDKTGKYIILLNKFSSFIVIIVSLIILTNIIDLIL